MGGIMNFDEASHSEFGRTIVKLRSGARFHEWTSISALKLSIYLINKLRASSRLNT